MKDLFTTGVHLFSEVGTHVLGHIFADKAKRRLESGHLSPNEENYLELRSQLLELTNQSASSLVLQEERLSLEKQQLAIQTQLSKEYLAYLHTTQLKEIELRVKELQANHDNQHWAGILSRQEALGLLTQTAGISQTRLLMVVSEPDISEMCPAAFRHELGKAVRGKLKQFIEKYYSSQTEYPVEFYGKFFRSAVFDTEIKQIEHVLSPLHLATIFSDVTRKEIMFHLRLWFGTERSAFSLATSFPWQQENKRLLDAGMSEEDSLEAVQDSIVAIHQLLAGMLADMYFLWINPLHEPRMFTLPTDKYPADWLNTAVAALRDMQASRLAEYEQALRDKEQTQELVPQLQSNKREHESWQALGKYRVRDGEAFDTETGLTWLRFAIGQRWDNGTVHGEPKEVEIPDLNLNIQSFNRGGGYGGYTDWRMPTIVELITLIDHYEGDSKKKILFVNNAVFPAMPDFLFSATRASGLIAPGVDPALLGAGVNTADSGTWFVIFSFSGEVSIWPRDFNQGYASLVRDGQ